MSLALLASSIALAPGCANDAAQGEPQNVTESNHALIPGPEVVRCWAEKGEGDDFFRADTLLCQRTDPGDFPIGFSGTVNVFTSDNNAAGTLLGDIAIDEPTVITKMRVEAYPIELKLDLSWDYESLGAVSGVESASKTLTHTWHIAQPNMEAQPVQFPYDIWSLGFSARKAAIEESGLRPYAVDLTPFTTQDGGSTMSLEHGSLPRLSLGESASAYVAVSRGASSVPAKATLDGEPIEFELTGPGVYVAEPGIIRPLDPNDAAEASDGPVYASCHVSEVLLPLPPDAPPDAEPDKVFEPSCQLVGVEHLDVTSLQATLVSNGAILVEPVALSLDGAPTALGQFDASAFPAQLELSASVTSDAIGFRSELTQTPMLVTLDLAGPTGEVVDAPVDAHLPFDFLSVTIDPGELMIGGDIDRYLVIMGHQWAGLTTLGVSNQELPFLSGTPATLTFVASSQQSSITANTYIIAGSDVHTDVPITLERGGSYVVTAEGLAPAPATP
jgi:hypothetical protein